MKSTDADQTRKEWITDPSFRFGNDSCLEETNVQTRYLDGLIAQYGVPAFIKLDVEGYEETALRGLTEPVPLLAFEWSIELAPEALAALKRLRTLGFAPWALRQGDLPFSEVPPAAPFAPRTMVCGTPTRGSPHQHARTQKA